MAAADTEVGYSLEQVKRALNRAADEIIDAADLDDAGCVDALNLLVNATVSYLEGSAGDLADVVAVNYDVESLLPGDGAADDDIAERALESLVSEFRGA